MEIDLDDIAQYADYAGRSAAETYGPTYEVLGVGYIVGRKHYPYSAFENVLAQASAASLASVFPNEHYSSRIVPAIDDGRMFDTLGSELVRGYSLDVIDGRVLAKVSQRFRDGRHMPELEAFINSYLSDNPCKLAQFTEFGDRPPHDFAWLEPKDDDTADLIDWKAEELKSFMANLADEPREVVATLELRPGNDRVFDLLHAAADLSAALSSMHDPKQVDVSVVQAWFRAGRFDLMLGLVENEWLEVKSQAYQVSSPTPTELQNRQKIELAQDVARFANGPVEAVLLIGYEEAKRGNESVLARVSPTALTATHASQYHAILDSRVFPAVVGLSIEVVEAPGGGSLMMITVPVQPAEMQPYLVHGAIVSGKYDGAFFSVMTRRGEGSITMLASQIHGYLVAGRAALNASAHPTVESTDTPS
ncbi:hypothetical protein C3B59_17240 [Cryobacterium zongtaii]|uniref:Uncharacterized protein n=2 Tax=Cryobacterium zongtaii TaxID=1259217 RepID=A0A2S3Z5W3_9MICO|nr:hypothetical protein C3B59_17240 [Cryobacterium zongtaii]